MISVRNLLLPLSGNSIKVLLVLVILFSSFNVEVKAKDKDLNIALLIPLNFNKSEASQFLDQKNFESSNLAIDYYRGFKLATDSLKANGYNLQIKIIDTESDTLKLKTLAADPYLMKCDYIFGPMTPDEIRILLKSNPSLKIVSPISPTFYPLWKNKEVIQANNTLEVHAANMAKFLSLKKPNNFLLVRNGLLAETRYSKAFQKSLDSLDKKMTMKEILTSKSGFGGIEGELSRTKENYILIPSSEQTFAIKLFKYLDGLKDQYPITLLVHPSWIEFHTIDPNQFVRYKVHLTSSFFADYENEEVKNFVTKYRSEFFTEPTEMAMRGFDQGVYFLSKFDRKPKGLFKNTSPEKQLVSLFHYPNNNDGWKNKALFILKYEEAGLTFQQ